MINVDGLMGFYIVGALVLFSLVLLAFIVSWSEKNTKNAKKR